jgi:glycosyltransferase involved in cell wall biosynthesis
MSPKISIITPSFNQGQYLEATIDSILSQGYDNLEYIVIDGGSQDDSVAIIEKYAKQISYWISERDGGQSEAINKGLKIATGDIVTWINSDDVLVPGALKRVAKLWSGLTEDIGVIHGGATVFNGERDLDQQFTYGRPCIERYMSGIAFPQPGAFIIRKYLDRAGLINESLHYGMDYDLFARLACVSKFLPVPAIFSRYRLHQASKTVAEGRRFRAEWTAIFFSLCNRLGWEDVVDLVKNFTGDLVVEKQMHENFLPDSRFTNPVDHEKLSFFFLADILKDHYWNDRRVDAKKLLRHMKGRFPAWYFKEDPRTVTVMKKLAIPDIILRGLKKLNKLKGE